MSYCFALFPERKGEAYEYAMIDVRERAIGLRDVRRTSLTVILLRGGLHLLRLKKLLSWERRWDTRCEARATRMTVLR